MTGNDICKKAKELKNYKYWYGGKGQTANKDLALKLKMQNPHVWTSSYYTKALKDIDGKTKVADCSYLVCYAYGRSQIGSYQIATTYKEYKGKPKNGMILWRKGHVAIFCDGKAIQMKGIDSDYCELDYPNDNYTKILYDPNVNYDINNIDIGDKKTGWHKDSLGWYYRHKEGTGEGTYYKQGIYPCNTKNGVMYFAFDDKGYMITDMSKIYITEYGNIEVK